MCLLWETGLCDYGAWEVPWSYRSNLETGESWWCNSEAKGLRPRGAMMSKNNQWSRKKGMNFSFFQLFFYSGPQWIGPWPPRFGRANHFLFPSIQMHFSTEDTFTDRNNVQSGHQWPTQVDKINYRTMWRHTVKKAVYWWRQIVEWCSSYKSRNTKDCQSYQKLGGSKKGFFPRAFRECGPVDTLVSDFYPLIELTNR